MRVRKRPVEVTAEQWDGTAEGAAEIITWVRAEGGTARYLDDCVDTLGRQCVRLGIDTLEGTMQAKPGDWVIRGVQGEFYPCDRGIFDQTYESTWST
jgi:hypothetical protein